MWFIRSALVTAVLITVAGPEPASSQAAADSLVVLRSARQEQTRFETLRRRNLPSTLPRGSSDCDERIGRFCLTRDDGEGEDWVPPAERPAIAPARERLIEHLAASARRFPGDRWVTGQRVHYLLEARRYTDAAAAALECRGERWWCSALAGIAAHYAGAAAAADSAFSDMLAAMSPTQRQQWTDLEDLLEPELARHFRRLTPTDRDRFLATYWGLADPFYSRSGNEVRSEHFARNLLDDLQDRAESPDNLRWGSDLREILLRFGWPTGWERLKDDRIYVVGGESYVSHYADTDRDILPPPEIFLDSGGVVAGEWDLENPAARATYAVRLADTVVSWLPPLEHQFARFYRGDTAIVVAAYTLPADSLAATDTLQASLATTLDGLSAGPVARLSEAPRTGALAVRAEGGAMVVSLELVAERARRAARARSGLRASPPSPGRLGVSDLLILRESTSPPESLEAAVAQARGSTRVRPGDNVGVYWEVYGLEDRPAGELTMTLRIVSVERGWLRRIAERARIVRAADPVQLRWQEPLQSGSIFSRTLGVQIPADSPGEYAIELVVSMPGEEDLLARQVIELSTAPD